MSSVNKAILVGNVGQAPTIHATKEGKKIASFSVATSENWTDKASGDKKSKTEWHKICVYNETLSSYVENYVQSGAKVYVEGQLQTTPYKDKQGVEKYQTQIIISKFKGEIKILSPKNSEDKKETNNSYTPDMNDDEIPF